MAQTEQKKILIVGGGFGGIRVALDLAKKGIPNAKIVLVSDKPHFEYSAALYRVVTGKSPLEVCIPLRTIFENKRVEVIEDSIRTVDLEERKAIGTSGSHYSFDFLVLALGSETAYFNIPGLREYAFGFKSITEALRLKKYLHEMLEACRVSETDREEDVCRMHIVVVGGGATGVELAGELALYMRKLAMKHKVDPSLLTIDVIEAAPRLLPALPEDISEKAERRLRSLGVNVFLNRTVTEQEVETVYLKDMTMKSKTVIWTAGVKPHHLYGEVEKLERDRKGRVIVDEFLQAKGHPNVFVIGDAAATPYAGMAQTAVHDGTFVADTIERKMMGRPLEPYRPHKPAYAIPIGPRWAAVLLGNLRFFGRFGWILRRLADLRFFLSILKPREAIAAYRSGKMLSESCTICAPQGAQ